MTYFMYLDDERNPKTKRDWKVVRSVEEAQHWVSQYGCPKYISFDHDLGDQVPTGFDFAKWLVDQDMESDILPPDFKFNVHSANPVGRANIQGYLDNYLDFRNREDK